MLETSYTARSARACGKTAEEQGSQSNGRGAARSRRTRRGGRAWPRAIRPRRSISTERERVAVSLVALGNQERMLVLQISGEPRRPLPTPSRRSCATPMRSSKARAAGAGLATSARRKPHSHIRSHFAPPIFFLYRAPVCGAMLADRLGERFETLLVTRMLVQRLAGDTAKHARSIFGERIEAIIDRMLKERLDRTQTRLDSLRRQYSDYLASLEARILRQSALRGEMGRYKALYEEGLIAFGSLQGPDEQTRKRAGRPTRRRVLTSGSDTERLIARLDLFAALSSRPSSSKASAKAALRARFTVPNELIVRKGEQGDAVYFIASGAVDVIFSDRRIPLGSGDFFGEMALITGEPRQADVRAQTYSRLLVLRKSDFDRFMRDNRDVRLKIREVAKRRLLENRPEAAAAT